MDVVLVEGEEQLPAILRASNLSIPGDGTRQTSGSTAVTPMSVMGYVWHHTALLCAIIVCGILV